MVRVSIVHPHLQDTTTKQMFQMERSRLRLLRLECHVALAITINMSSSKLFSGAKLIFLHPSAH
jgi:porphobilinogen deaminase